MIPTGVIIQLVIGFSFIWVIAQTWLNLKWIKVLAEDVILLNKTINKILVKKK